ncbi:hypothetical protein WJX81_005019 [Elliptochloris bilobata]|uniref:J domain-containing protein n=1 Tax=Elliptochloris bilobata TaxID=381761 RepID=A0AAW1RD47_9CHLO
MQQVKRQWRTLAKQYHPDLNTSQEAAAQYERIRCAAESILSQNRPAQSGDASAAAEAAARRWRPETMSRNPRFALYFSALSVLGGCAIFAGALHVHQDLYTYNVVKEVEARRRNPTEAQRRISELLQQEHARKAWSTSWARDNGWAPFEGPEGTQRSMKPSGLSPRAGVRRRAVVAPMDVVGHPELSLLQRAARRQRETGDGWRELPTWQEQLTFRMFGWSVVVGVPFTVIVLKLSLTAGIIPGMAIPIAMIGWVTLMWWVRAAQRCGFRGVRPFTVMENTLFQTCCGSISGLAFTGGFGMYLTAMSRTVYLSSAGVAGNNPNDVVDPDLRRVIPYLLLISLIGNFIMIQLRKRFIVDYRLPYPSSTVAGIVLNSLHVKGSQRRAVRQVKTIWYTGIVSFLWSCVRWNFGRDDVPGCGGFELMPTFGRAALRQTMNFDWQLNYVGVGMICPHIVDWSMLLGAVLAFGVMWPAIAAKAGDWYPAGLKERDFSGLYGYKVFFAVAVFLGEGMYHFMKIFAVSLASFLMHSAASKRGMPVTAVDVATIDAEFKQEQVAGTAASKDAPANVPVEHTPVIGGAALAAVAARPEEEAGQGEEALDEKDAAALEALRNDVFMRGAIPWWVAMGGYVGFAALGAACIPVFYPQLKWYMVLVAFAVAPVFSVANAYGAGVTDWDQASLFGKLGIFAFAAWGGAQGGGVIAGLAVCGILLTVTSAAAGLMGDFRTGWITLTSPRSMFVAQVVGSLMGCFVAPLVFMFLNAASPVGGDHSIYPAPYALVYRAMAILGTRGVAALPSHCVEYAIAFFVASFAVSALRDALLMERWSCNGSAVGRWANRVGQVVPIPMAFALPFYLGGNYAVDMAVGSIVKGAWQIFAPGSASDYVPMVASGLIAGDGLWAIPSAVTALAGGKAPFCITGFYKG